MGFKFPLQALLKKNKYEEELAKKEFAEAQAILNKTLQKIAQHEEDIVNAREQMSSMQVAGGQVLGGLDYRTNYIDGLKTKISNLQEIAREQMTFVEEKKQAMIRARQEYKKIEVLRDKSLKEYKHLQKKKAEKTLDDIINMRFKRQ